jgi:hypothetical protein
MTVNSVGDDGSVICHYFDFSKHEMVTVTLTTAELRISPRRLVRRAQRGSCLAIEEVQARLIHMHAQC